MLLYILIIIIAYIARNPTHAKVFYLPVSLACFPIAGLSYIVNLGYVVVP